MKAIIRLDVPDWQIGQEVKVYFPDTMCVTGTCEDEERPKGKWITFKTNRLIMQCPECTAFLSRERTDIFKDKIGNVNYCPNCGARMED